jgi:hypothetical protein
VSNLPEEVVMSVYASTFAFFLRLGSPVCRFCAAGPVLPSVVSHGRCLDAPGPWQPAETPWLDSASFETNICKTRPAVAGSDEAAPEEDDSRAVSPRRSGSKRFGRGDQR